MSDVTLKVANEEGELVEASIFVGHIDTCTMLKRFPMTKSGYDKATEFIGTLHGHEDGIYYLDCPVLWEDLEDTVGEIVLTLSEYEASVVLGGLSCFIDQFDHSYPADANTCKQLTERIETLQRGE